MPGSKIEIEALWRELFGGPPPIDATPEMLIAVLVRCLPQPAPYGYHGGARFEPPQGLIAKPLIED
jgi:hypothetical protein